VTVHWSGTELALDAMSSPMPVSHPMPALDDEGYLIDPELWNESIAEELARREGITLGDDHWNAMRKAI
jgi:sulfur relay (sulfurtransferase) DsrC/TusE family protein